jgi:hypothetical protein
MPVNPDGTVQVAPPTMSAFGPASASAPPPPQQSLGDALGGAPPSGGQPGFAGAIMALLHSIFGKAPTTDNRTNDAVEKMSK